MSHTLSFPVPSAVGSLDQYIQSVNRVPLLTEKEESELAHSFRENEDLDAARKLVMSHLRLVVAIARGYLGYGLPHADLIQEGNVGLMKAVKRFDPDRGVRLVSFAIHWMKAEGRHGQGPAHAVLHPAQQEGQQQHPAGRRRPGRGAATGRQARRSARNGNPPVGPGSRTRSRPRR